ncbi:MAG: fatty acid--CoA ligase [Deltaproteobacteria bacterium]|nr:fatty acid--CoA ligase [Deltaproteobacteria bacterium]
MDKQPRLIQRTPSAYSYPLLIKNILITPILYAPDQEIVYRDKLRMTYRDLYQRINRLASALTGLGVGYDDTVGVMDWDSHRYLECFFAVPMMGSVLHTVNVRLSAEQIVYTVNHAEDTVLLVNEEFIPLLESVADQLTTVRKIILLKDSEEGPKTTLSLAGEYEALLAKSSPEFEFPDFDENTMATLFYTTGTTGDPKGVYYSHRQLVLHTFDIGMALSAFSSVARFQSSDVYMPITPMFHVHAWGIPYLATLMGCKQVYPGRYEPAMLLKLLLSEKVTFSHCVPTILHMLVTSPIAKQVNLSNWKVVIGGSALPKGLAKASMDLGIEIIAAYGMSETCPLLTAANLKPKMMDWSNEDKLDVLIKTGLPTPLVNLKIVDSKGNAVPHDGVTTGEIVVRTPWLTQGYFKSPEKSEELWKDGWLHTGDVANIDSEGYVKITDRVKDVIKTGGEWISSLELESLISQHPSVSEVAVIGVPDEKWGERPVALVVLGPDHTFSEDILRAYMQGLADKGAISKWAIPDRFYHVQEIPKTSVGKLNKKVIRQKVSEGAYN